jgi:phage terminase small subunit
MPASQGPPEWLDSCSAELWRELAPELACLGILKQTDLLIFSALCQTYAELRNAESPTAKLNWLAMLLRYAREFGLTPASRAGITATPAEKTDNGKDSFFKIVG